MSKSFTSLEKTIDILCSFDMEHQDRSAYEIYRHLNMPLSTTYKYLDMLLRKGFVSKDPDTKKFSLGLTIFKMGNLVAAKMTVLNIATPHINSLSKRSGETVILTVVHGWEALCVEEIESPKMVKLTIKRGATIPLHAGASQKILLAYQDDAFIDDMIKGRGLAVLNENTITDLAELEKELKSIRDQGYAMSDSEVDSGAGAVAAPIFDHRGKLVAGLTIAGPRDRICGKSRQKLIDTVIESAKRISSDLGYMKGTMAVW